MKTLWMVVMIPFLVLGLCLTSWAASEVYGPFSITIPDGLYSHSCSWVDQDETRQGIQIDVVVQLSDARQQVKVSAEDGSFTGQKPYLGSFDSKRVGNDAFLEYAIVYVCRVGDGIQVQAIAITNSAENYTGSNANILNFQEDYQVGTVFTYTLAWNDREGNNIDLGSRQHLASWRQMYQVGSHNMIQMNPFIAHLVCEAVKCPYREYPH